MRRARAGWGPAAAALLIAHLATAAGPHDALLRRLNEDDTVKGTEQSKSYKLLFDAYLKLAPPPMPVGPEFNQTTIHPGMKDWESVADWAESGQALAEAIIRCRTRNILGLPYGDAEVPSAYREAGLVAAIASDGSLRRNEFPYLDAFNVIAAYATAEMYRRIEANDGPAARELAFSFNWVLRQLCDREFYREKWHAIALLLQALSNERDVLYTHQDRISPDLLREFASWDIPDLRPGRDRLELPEGDRVVAEALLDEVFDRREQADPDKFAEAFAWIQATEAPLTRFGAARRWRNIAALHGSLQASKERLKFIYDDWWRRWRVQEYDPILALESQFDLTNPVRYAAVIYSMEDIEAVFDARNQLIASVNGTSLAAGLSAYKRTLGVYPDDKEKLYGQFVRKLSDIDPYDEEYGPMRYVLVSRRTPLDALGGRLWIEPGECLLYCRGGDNLDNRAESHTEDASAGDYVLWPPVRALARRQGLIR